MTVAHAKHSSLSRYRHLFFDLDDTLTPTRSPISKEMQTILLDLRTKRDIIVVSGARVEQIRKQMGDNFPAYYLGQNGNQAHNNIVGECLWHHVLKDDEKEEVLRHIQSIPRTWIVSNESDLIEDRECQISYSLIGHNENLEKKKSFDPDRAIRRRILEDFPFVSEKMEVKIGGTTCFDYFRKGAHKGSNIEKFIKLMGWEKENCAYVGDALVPGGNDETVIGIIDTVSVANQDETLELLRLVPIAEVRVFL